MRKRTKKSVERPTLKQRKAQARQVRHARAGPGVLQRPEVLAEVQDRRLPAQPVLPRRQHARLLMRHWRSVPEDVMVFVPVA